MNRRTFLTATTAAASSAAVQPLAAAPAAPPVLMKLGCQSSPTTEKHVGYLARYGVRNICGYPEVPGDRLYATVEELKRIQDIAGKYKVSIDCVAAPFLASSHIDREKHPAIM